MVLEPYTARELLRRRDLPKGRSRESQWTVGGYVAREGDDFRRRRRDVIAALSRAARDLDAMRVTLGQVIPQWPADRRARPSAFTRWMLHDLVGPDRQPIDEMLLTDGIAEAWRAAESADTRPEHQGDVPRRTALLESLAGDSELGSGAFVTDLRGRGWSSAEIAGELVALALAGWESTSAAVTSARTFGMGRSVDDVEVEQLLCRYPPSWLIVRELAEPVTWGEPGDLALVSPWLLSQSADPAAAMPFGVGPRKCPAELYSRAQIAVALAAFGGVPAEVGAPGLVDRRSAALLPISDRTVA